MIGFIELAVAILVALALVSLTVRTWRVRNPVVRIVGGLVATLVTVVVAAVSLVGMAGVYRLYAPHGSPATATTVSGDAALLAVGTRRANGCAACHSSTGSLPLDGGTTSFLGPLGTLVAPNLTPGGPLKDWSDGEIVRAIREGIDRNGRPLLIMPSEAFHTMSDSDAQALVAYLRSQPASSAQTPARDLSLMGLAIVGSGLFPTAEQPHITGPQTAPAAAVTPEYGKYLIDVTGCASCHGPTLQGRAPSGFGPPAGPNIRALVPTWEEEPFVRFFRTGVDPYGRSIDPETMPWKDIGLAYTDDELRAMYAYLKVPL